MHSSQSPAHGIHSRPGAEIAGSGGSFGRAALSAVIAFTLPTVGCALAQGPTTGEGSTAALQTYLSDLYTAANLSGAVTRARALDAQEAAAALDRARLGLSASGTFQPATEYEYDLAAGGGAWDHDIELELSAEYAYDREQVLRAEIALARATARLRAQQRSDVERALLALSTERLQVDSLARARLEASDATAAWQAAVAAEAASLEIETLALSLARAELELEQELLAQAEAEAALEALGLSSEAPAWATWAGGRLVTLSVPPGPEIHQPEGAPPLLAPELPLLSFQLLLAEQQLSLAPFETLRELELYGGYEVNGLEAGARLALEVGVPTAGTTLGWQSGSDDHVFIVGLGATLRLSDSSSADLRVTQHRVAEARGALAAHVAGWAGERQRAEDGAALAFREFELELRGLALSRARLEQAQTGTDERELASARTAVGRAVTASERAWQRYVRALFDYLDVIDVVLRFD